MAQEGIRKARITLGLVVLLGFGLTLAWLIHRLFVIGSDFFRNANPTVVAALIALMATVISGALIASLTQIYNQRREREEAHRAKKTEIYSGYMELLRRLQAEGNEHLQGLKFAEGELIMRLSEVKRDFVLWASPDVINAQLEFESTANQTPGVFKSVDKLLLAFRKDLGLSNNGLNKMQLLRMQVKKSDWPRLV